MAFTTAKMGLKIWNLLTDLYDHAQLADNWAKVDYHDHSPGKGVQIPTDGLADGAVTAAKLSASVDPSGAFGTYRTFWRGVWQSNAAPGAATYLLTSDAATLTSGGAGSARAFFYINPADYANPGRTAVLRVEQDLFTNAVAPGAAVNFVAGLYPSGALGGTSGNPPSITAGTVVAGSTAAVNNPGAASANHIASADFPIPAAGYYAVGIAQSTGAAAGSVVAISARLSVRAV